MTEVWLLREGGGSLYFLLTLTSSISHVVLGL